MKPLFRVSGFLVVLPRDFDGFGRLTAGKLSPTAGLKDSIPRGFGKGGGRECFVVTAGVVGWAARKAASPPPHSTTLARCFGMRFVIVRFRQEAALIRTGQRDIRRQKRESI